MFTCNQCHQKQYGTSIRDIHFAGSFGPCEWCRVTGPCDCHCQKPGTVKAAMKTMEKAAQEELAEQTERIRAEFRKKDQP